MPVSEDPAGEFAAMKEIDNELLKGLAGGAYQCGLAIKKQLTAAIPFNRHYHRSNQVRQYFQGVEATVDNLQPLFDQLPPAKILELIDYTLKRIDKALETIDDSGGFRFPVLEVLADLHISTLARSGFSQQQLADHLLKCFNSPLADFYPEIPDYYAEVLGDDGMRCFIKKLNEVWDQLPPLTEPDWQRESLYRQLMYPLLQRARASNDLDRIIILTSKISNDFSDYLDLARLCLENDQPDQAIEWHQRAEAVVYKLYNHKIALENSQLAIWEHTGNYPEMLATLWRRFSDHPGMEDYLAINEVPGQPGSVDNQRKAIAVLKERIAGQEADSHHRQNAINTLAQLYLYHEKPGDALECAEAWPIAIHLLLSIAEANKRLPERILPLIFRVARLQVNQGDNKGYRAAIDTFRAGQKMVGADNAEFLHQLKDFHEEFRRKRNFYDWMKEAFEGLG